jgi:hypothetical protein
MYFMTATGHAVIGTVIAAKIGDPYLAIPIAIGSHVLADMFPHWDSGTNGKHKSNKQFTIEATIDVLVGFVVAYLLIYFLFPQTNLFYAFVVIIASQLLDWLSAPYFAFNMKFPPFTWLHSLQSSFNTRLDKPWGVISQVVAGVILILIAKTY